MKIINGEIVNTEADNKFIENWLNNQPKMKVKQGGKCKIIPLVTMSNKFDILKVE